MSYTAAIGTWLVVPPANVAVIVEPDREALILGEALGDGRVVGVQVLEAPGHDVELDGLPDAT